MMKNTKRLCLLVIAFLFSGFFAGVKSQEILLTISDKQVTKDEFVRIYKKNNSPENLLDTKSVSEYLELFINFKLKVLEAEKQGLDTTASFQNEFNSYLKQLAKPYFIDKEVEKKLLQEAYERSKTEVRVSHIVVRLDINATPEDTMKAYEKALKIRNRLLKGEKFDVVAKETSDDPSASRNGGDLWYLSPFRSPYVFENYIYTAKLNELSMPLRTSWGFHITKVTDRRAAQGQVKVAHIMVATPKDAHPDTLKKSETKAMDIYKQLKNGSDFVELAKKYSDDKGTAKTGGELNWFSTGIMIPEFETAAFSLKNNGDISEPVKTIFGYHIIKRIDYKPLPSFTEMEKDLQNRLNNDDRNNLSSESVINRLKKEYNFKDAGNLKDFYTVVDTSIFFGKWEIEKAQNLNKPLFSLNEKTYQQSLFAEFLVRNKKTMPKVPIVSFVDNQYKQFVAEIVNEVETQNLEKKYEDFRFLKQEYHDGILLFDLTDKMVWSKAVKDTIGLKNFFDKNKSNYLDSAKLDVSIFSYIDDATKKAAEKQLKSKTSKKLTDSIIVENVGKEKLKLVKSGKFSKGMEQTTDLLFDMIAKGSISEKQNIVNLADKKYIIIINKRHPIQPRPFDDVKGLVTADYQNQLEQLWIKELRSKYKVTVNENVLQSIQNLK